MYLDTLKVSTVEQTASQSTARGGLGNPSLITWDYGKEITVQLEDALYTPASQSLMWGGKFGIKKTKLYGVWNPYIYPTDSYGRTLYIQKVTTEGEPVNINGKWIFLQESDNILYTFTDDTDSNVIRLVITDEQPTVAGETVLKSYLGYNSLGGIVGRFSITQLNSTTFHLIRELYDSTIYGEIEVIATGEEATLDSFICPCDGDKKWIIVEPNQGHYKYYHDQSTWEKDQMELTEYNCPSDNPIYESEEISRALGKYTISGNSLDNAEYWNNSRPERAIITVNSFGQFEYHAYEFVSTGDPETEYCFYKDIDFCDTDVVKCTEEPIDAYGYIWQNSDLKMTSLEGTQDIYLLKDTDLRYRIRVDNGLREISLEYHIDNDGNYQPKIDVFKTITYSIRNDDGILEEKKVKVMVGTFYIIDDWNSTGVAPQEFIYEIESGLENVSYLERMETCQAPQTFAIDADKNVRCNNYRFDRDYDETELTVFLNPKTMKPYEPNSSVFVRQSGEQVTGNLTIIKKGETYLKWTRTKAPDYTSLGYQIIVDAEHYPGTYKLVGETYARPYGGGQDQRFQFEIPLCKMSADTRVTLSAADAPTTFSMSFKVLRKNDGQMMKLTQYSVENKIGTGSTQVVPIDGIIEDKEIPNYPDTPNRHIETRYGGFDLRNPSSELEVVSPSDSTSYRVDLAVDGPFRGVWPYVEKITDEELAEIVDNRNVPTSDSTSTVNVYNETLSNTFDPDMYKDKTIVKNSTTYDKFQEVYSVYVDELGHETEVPNSRHYVPTGQTVTSIRFLSPNEYSTDVEGGDDR